MLLGVIIREITDPFFAYAIEAVSMEAASHGYNVVLGHAHGRADEALALWAVLEARHCDGILIVGDMRDEPRLIEDLATARLPVVALWHGALVSGLPTVTVDNRAGILSVLEHLVSLGHERIAFIGGRRIGGDNRQREDSFLTGLEARGLTLPDGYLLTTANDPEWGVEALGRLLELPEPPTAIVCSTDLIASGVLHGAHERGLSVPRDLSVTGFDDLPMATYTVPSLTTVLNPIREVVSKGVTMILDLIEEHTPDGPPEHVVIEPRLVVRNSTGPVRPAGPRRGSPRRN
jgi:DNA-binding LacI/PurR family transcriptional regulator